jgi:hypothetical protein
MFEIEILKSLLGRPIQEPELVGQLMLATGMPILDEDVFTAYVERQPSGYCLTFTDEAIFLRKDQQRIGQGPLYFTGIFFYADGKNGYTGYQGELPEGVTFLDSRDEILRRLGPSSFQRARDDQTILSDRWVRSDYSLSVTYSKLNDTPTVILFFKPYEI